MKYFFELIQVAVGRRTSLSGIASGQEWQRIFHEAKRQALLGVLFRAIEQLPAEQRPPKILLLKWFDLSERIKRQNHVLNEEAVRVGRLLEEHGVAYTFLKGQGNALYYPDPLLRTPGDLDVWVRNVHTPCRSLSQKRCVLYDFVKKEYGSLEGVSYNHVHAPLSSSVEVELHVTPTYMSAWYLNAPLQRYFKDFAMSDMQPIRDLPENIGSIHVPTVEFNRLYLLLHIYRHFFSEGIGLRQLMDYYYTLRQPSTRESRERTIKMLQQQKLEKFAGAVMFVLERVFGLEEEFQLVAPDVEEGRFLLQEILWAGNFGQYDRRIDRKAYQNRWARFFLSLKRNVRFIRKYPHEILFDGLFRASFYVYRKVHGWS